MGELLTAIPVADAGAVALLAVTVWLILSGRLVPRISLLDEKASAAQWREAYEAQLEINREQSKQTQLLENQQVTNKVLEHFLTQSNREQGGES